MNSEMFIDAMIENDNESAESLSDNEEEELELIPKFATLEEVIKPNTYPAYGYVKFYNPKHELLKDEKPTGGQFDFTRCRGLAIVDVDVKHSLNDDHKAALRKNLIDSLKDYNVVVVQTPHGGLHIYCRDDGKIQFKMNRNVKCAATEVMEFDIFVSVKPNEKGKMGQQGNDAGATVPETQVKFYDSNEPNEIHTYEFVAGGWDSVIDGNLFDILCRLGISSQVREWVEKNVPRPKRNKRAKEAKEEPKEEKTYSEEQLDYNTLLVDGLKDIKAEVHNSKHTGVKLDKELTLFDLVVAIKGLDKENIEYATEVVQEMNLTDKASANFERNFVDKLDDDNIEGNASYLRKILEIHNPEYYHAHVIPELYKLTGKFDATQPIKRVNAKDIDKASSITEKMFLFCQGLRNLEHMNMWMSRINTDEVLFKKDEEVKRLIRGYVKGSKQSTAIFDELMMKVRNSDVLSLGFSSIFTGWHFGKCKSQNYDENVRLWCECIKTNTFGQSPEAFDYIMERMSFILNNPGKLSKVSLVLKGIEGTGKNFYCDCMAKLTEGYSNANAELSKITGRFNSSVFGKAYVVANEALDTGNKLEQMEQIKKLVERPVMDYERKGLETFSGENASNIDITSNNTKPVLLSPTDRRFCVAKSSTVHANDRDYWRFYQEELINREGFWDDLHIYITSIPCNEFLNKPIPGTEERSRLILASLNPVMKFIYNHLEEFGNGVSREWISEHWNDDSETKGKYSRDGFVNAVIDSCERVKITHGTDKDRIRYFLNNATYDSLAVIQEKFRGEDKEDDEPVIISADELEKEKEEIKEYVEDLAQTNEKYKFILNADIAKSKKAFTEEYLKANGWVVDTHLGPKRSRTGWKHSL